jgi:hypothetical protein
MQPQKKSPPGSAAEGAPLFGRSCEGQTHLRVVADREADTVQQQQQRQQLARQLDEIKKQKAQLAEEKANLEAERRSLQHAGLATRQYHKREEHTISEQRARLVAQREKIDRVRGIIHQQSLGSESDGSCVYVYGRWEFIDDDDEPECYELDVNAKLEHAMFTGEKRLAFAIDDGSTCEVDFDHMVERDLNSSETRAVQRISVGRPYMLYRYAWQTERGQAVAAEAQQDLERRYEEMQKSGELDGCSLEPTIERYRRVIVEYELLEPDEQSAGEHDWLPTTPCTVYDDDDEITMHCIDISQIDDTLESRELQEWNFATQQFQRLMHGNINTVRRVEVWSSPKVQIRFDQYKARQRQPGNVHWVFHGTNSHNLRSIMTTGFCVGGQGVPVKNGTAYGTGVYTATGPATPFAYSSGDSLILARGYCGAQEQLGGSWGAGDHRRVENDWIIFRTPDQLVPVYVLHFGHRRY